MSALILPAKSKLALSLREPNLLVPGRKPIDSIAARTDRNLCFAIVPQSRAFIDLVSGISIPQYSGNGLYGSDASGVYVGSTSTSTPGYEAQGFSPLRASNGDGTGDFSVAFVANPTTSAYGWLISQRQGEASEYTQINIAANGAGTYESGKLGVVIYNTAANAYNVRTSASVIDGNTHVFIIVRRNGVIEFYVDGAAKSATTVSGAGTGAATGIYSNQQSFAVGGAAEYYSGIGSQNSKIYGLIGANRAFSSSEIEQISRSFYAFAVRSANQSPFLISIPGGGGVSYDETIDGAITSGGNLSPVLAANLGLSGALATDGYLAPVADFNLPFAGALSSGGDLADSFSAGAVTYDETLDGALQSGGDMLPVVAYGLGLDGALQSGGNLADTFSGAGLWEEALSGSMSSGGDLGIVYAASAPMDGALSTGGDLVPVLSSSITAIGSIASGGDLVVFVAYQQPADGALQSAGDLADAFTSGTGSYSEAFSGALISGGDLVPVVQWGVLADGALTVGGDLADVSSVTDCTDVPTYTAFDAAKDALFAAVLDQFGEEVTFPGIGLTITAVFKRYRDTVPAGGARPGVPRDELRVKQTDICAYDVDQGTTVTVRGQAYKVISVERTKHGMTNLGIRRTH